MTAIEIESRAELATRELARRRFGRFIKYRMPEYRENWHHTMLINALEEVERGKIKKLMVFMPPQNGKSELVSVNFPPWFFGRNPRKSIIAASYNSELAVDFGRKARDIVASREYHNVFFETALKEDTKAAGHWTTNEGGEYTAVGIGGGTTGRHADIFIIDDPVKDLQEASSSVIQQRNIGWYRSVARTRLSSEGATILIQTRWSDADLAGQILETEKDWTIINLAAIAERDEKFRKEGEALWPEQFPLAWLVKQKADMGPELFSALYQQQPIGEQSQVFNRSMFRYREVVELEGRATRCFVTLDPAPGKSEKSDYVGVCVNWVDAENMWNLKAYQVKFDSAQMINLLFKLYSETHFEKVGIEQGMYTDVLKPFLDQEMVKRGIFFDVEELKHEQRSKELRIRGLSPRYNAHQIFHLKGYCNDLEQQLLRFPKSVHDDVMDAVAYQSQIAEPPEGATAQIEIEDHRRQRMSAVQKDSGL